MNQSAAFKDFFLIPWPRIRYLAWNILRAILRLFLSFPLILSFSSLPSIPVLHLVFQRSGDGLFVGNALREREREKGKGRKEATWNWKRGENGRVVTLSRAILFPGWSCTRGNKKRKRRISLMVVIFVPGLLLEIFFFSSFGIWKDLIEDRSEIEGIGNLVHSSLGNKSFLRSFSLGVTKKSKRNEKYRNRSIKFNGHNTWEDL